jgi:hypothetical protein
VFLHREILSEERVRMLLDADVGWGETSLKDLH